MANRPPAPPKPPGLAHAANEAAKMHDDPTLHNINRMRDYHPMTEMPTQKPGMLQRLAHPVDTIFHQSEEKTDVHEQ